MKTKRNGCILLSAVLGLTLFFGGGCAKKEVDPPLSSEAPSFEGGTNIDYPAANGDGYSESSIGAEGTLDDSGNASANGDFNGGSGMAGINSESEEYKLKYGRSSMGLSPVYYNFDQATIRADMQKRMADNAAFLKNSPSASVVIEGNTDERGTKEYNLALSQRRALNAKQYMVNLGIESSRIRTISYGEERPLFLDQNEFSYAQNRRCDFVAK